MDEGQWQVVDTEAEAGTAGEAGTALLGLSRAPSTSSADAEPSVSASETASSSAALATGTAQRPIDEQFLAQVFPGKDAGKLAQWLRVLQSEELECVGDAAALLALPDEEGWGRLPLPMAVRATLRDALLKELRLAAAPAVREVSQRDSASAESEKLQQLDCIVLDVSGSMKSRSVMDQLKTREDISKLMFHTMVDRILALEMGHAVGLIAFGARVDVIGGGLTEHFEAFHDELGRLDARQSQTRLYDAVDAATDMLLAYKAAHADRVGADCKLRVFALTDGADNASSVSAWEAARKMQEAGVVMDAFPLGPANPLMQSVASSTGGFCVDVTSEQQGLALFEREALLHVAARNENEEAEAGSPATERKVVQSAEDLGTFVRAAAVVQDVKAALPQKLLAARVMTSSEIKKSAGTGSAAAKRVMKEYQDIVNQTAKTPDGEEPDFRAFVSAEDVLQWKVVLKGPEGTPYAKGYFVLTFQFPTDYPFKPPRVRFATPIYHCNINNDGAICLDILKDTWAPSLTAHKMVLAVRALLSDPNAVDPLDAFKAQVYMTEKQRYQAEAEAATLAKAHASLEDAMRTYNLCPPKDKDENTPPSGVDTTASGAVADAPSSSSVGSGTSTA